MALMGYLIYVTARSVPKIWNPYDILGISEVCFHFLRVNQCGIANKGAECYGEGDQVTL